MAARRTGSIVSSTPSSVLSVKRAWYTRRILQTWRVSEPSSDVWTTTADGCTTTPLVTGEPEVTTP